MFQELDLQIVLELERNSTHIRDLASKIKSSPATVMRRLIFLKENNVVDVIDEGRNSRYFLKDSFDKYQVLYMAQNYRLLKFVQVNPALKSMIVEIKNIVRGSLTVIYGSFAKGMQNNKSDIDIFVESDDRNIKSDIEMINSRLSVKIGPFDKNNPLIKEIVKDKVIVCGFERFYDLMKVNA